MMPYVDFLFLYGAWYFRPDIAGLNMTDRCYLRRMRNLSEKILNGKLDVSRKERGLILQQKGESFD